MSDSTTAAAPAAQADRSTESAAPAPAAPQQQPQQQYAPPAGPPPAGQYPPPPGAPPPPGQYPPPAGSPPVPGQYPGYYPGYPPPAGYPGYPQYPGAPPPQGYPGYPPPGAPGAPGQPPVPYYNPYAPQQPWYPPPLGAPTGQDPNAAQNQTPGGAPAPPAAPGQAPFPAAAYHPSYPPAVPGAPPAGYAPGYPAHPGAPAPSGFAVWYLGCQIPDPNAPAAPLGAEKVQGYNPESTYTRLMKLVAGGGASDVDVGTILLGMSVKERDALNDYFVAKSGRTLAGWVESVISTEAKPVLVGLALGPLAYDVDLLRKALQGIGTDEMLLTELILNRPQEELRMLIAAYKQRFGKDLVDAVKSDLSGKLERMFVMALNTQRTPDSVPVDPTQVNTDVEVLVTAAKKKEEMPFIEIFVNRSQPHLAAVITAYGQRHKSLSKVIKRTFSGDLMRALLYILHGVKPKRDGQGIWRDAKLLEKTMAGLGTRDATLIYRTIRAHWNPQRFEAIKTAYKNRYGKSLESRISGETSGGYKKVMVAIVKSTENR